ncbi:MAG: HNH endonuclease, partial [Planctomycetes bacterium]|nr:HNH endonuclease [Planctomycetota bacterium]
MNDTETSKELQHNDGWRPVPDVDGKYEASIDGQIRRTQTTLSDQPFPDMTPQRSRGCRGLFLGLRHAGRTQQVSVARLVGRVFLEFPRKAGIVYWLDANEKNNAVENLAWAARHEDIPAHMQGIQDAVVSREDEGVEWRPVVGYEGIYIVSEAGGVRRIIPGRRGRAGRFLQPSPGGLGYVYVTLSRNGEQTHHPVHRVVAKAFIPLPKGLRAGDLVVDHILEPKSDNRVTNLRWATHGQNMEHAADEAALRKLQGEPPRSRRFDFSTVPDDAIWRPLAAFGIGRRFEVSNYGHVRRCQPGRNTTVGRMMAGRLTQQGYVLVKMRVHGMRHGVTKTAHILVASAFLPAPQPGERVIDHINGDKTDNRPCNLEWVTQQENTRRAVAAGRFHHNGRHVAAKLSQADVNELRCTAGDRTREGHASHYGVSPSTIDDALTGRTHASVGVPAAGKCMTNLRRGESHPRAKLIPERVREIVRRRRTGEPVDSIAAAYGISPATIYQIMRGLIWQHVTGIDRRQVGFRESQEDFFTAGLAACEEWHRRHGSLATVKVEDEINGFPIGSWIDRRRGEFRKGELSAARRLRLEALGIVWNPRDERWQRGMAAARLWVERNSDLSDVPVTAEIEGFALGRWLATRRVERNTGELAEDRIESLSALGFNWKPKRGPKTSLKCAPPD